MNEDKFDVLFNLSKKFKVYAHPMRLMILYSIYTKGECCVYDICKHIKNNCQPIVSQHLSILKKNGIVKSRVIKNKRVYEVVDTFILSVIKELVAAEEKNNESL